MPYCIDCGHEVDKVNREHRCLACAFDRAEQAAKQLREKQGPFYRRWKEGMRKYLDRRKGWQNRENGS